jgi:hypothetical protein
MSSHAENVDPPACEFDGKQHVEGAQKEALHGEEVTGEDTMRLGSEELRPARPLATRRGAQVVVAQQATDRAGRHFDSQLDELTANAQAAPPWILSGQAKHQFADSRFERWAAAAGRAPKGPLAAHEFPMPAQESGRGHQKREP